MLMYISRLRPKLRFACTLAILVPDILFVTVVLRYSAF
jgi:hypothetical protein